MSNKHSQTKLPDDIVRLDQWLQAARFFKTRTLSGQSIKTGKVLLNGTRVKPAHAVKVDDMLIVRRGDEIFELTVLALSKRRGSATIARTLFEETAASLEARMALKEQRKFTAFHAPGPERRPDKKSRRQIIEFVRGKK